MKPLRIDLPLDARERAAWLEQQLLSRELRSLVLQLKAVPEDLPRPVREDESEIEDPTSFDEWMSGKSTRLQNASLQCLDERELAELVRNPDWLCDLQSWVFAFGGDYWKKKLNDAMPVPESVVDVSGLVGRAWREEANSLRPISAEPRRSRRALFALIAIAAAGLLAVGLWQRNRPKGWGFQNSDLLASSLPGDEYLDSLAEAAQAWFNQRPTDVPQLVKRLSQFSDGCQTLLDAEHPQLADADRVWLVGVNGEGGKCGDWKDEVDRLRTILESDSSLYAIVLSDADDLIDRLTKTLQDRATEVRLRA